MVVLSPPGMMSESSPCSCSGFRTSTPLTPILLSAAPPHPHQSTTNKPNQNSQKRRKKTEAVGAYIPAKCSLKEPCSARTPTTAIAAAAAAAPLLFSRSRWDVWLWLWIGGWEEVDGRSTLPWRRPPHARASTSTSTEIGYRCCHEGKKKQLLAVGAARFWPSDRSSRSDLERWLLLPCVKSGDTDQP